MSVGQRLFWIAAIAIGAAFSAGMYLAGLESLARLLKLAQTDHQIGPTATPAQRAGEGAVMRKQMIETAAYEVATQVRAVEDSIEAALAEIAELQSRMVRARGRHPRRNGDQPPGVRAACGDDRQPHRGARQHRRLPCRAGRGRKTIPGLRTVGFGDADDCPPSGVARPAHRRLKAALTGPQQCGPVARSMLPHSVYWSLLLLICGYAFWRGRGDERLAAAPASSATLIQLLLVSPAAVRYSGVEIGVLAVDFGVLAVFVAIALQSNRFWPLWTAGLQLTTIFGH